MFALRAALFALVFYGGTALAMPPAAIAAWRGPAAIRRFAYGWAGFFEWCSRRLLGVVPRIEGEVPRGLVLVAAKHQSMWETIMLVRLLEQPAVVLKRELTEIPAFGRALLAHGAIPVDRDGSGGAMRLMLRAAKAAVADGRPILLFPEGTRVAWGQAPPLRPGFAGLYKALGVPVVPVAMDSGRLWGRGAIPTGPGEIVLRFGDPIPPGLPREEAEAQVHAAINALR